MALGDSAGILFRIKAVDDGASSEIKKVKGDIGGLGDTTSKAGIDFSKFAGPAAAAGAAILAVGAAAVTAAVAVFNLSKAASEYGSKIYDASQRTGMSTRAISALKLAAERSGASFDQVTKGVTEFGIMMGEAANGSEKAQEKLASLGVTSTDLDAALAQVFTTINNGVTDTDKLALATAAFGKEIGPQLIPLIKDADGSFEKLQDNAERLGLALSGRAAKAANDFGDSLDDLTAIATAVGYQFVTEFMPQITAAMDAIIKALIENKATWIEWGRNVNAVINGARISLPYLQNAALTFFNAMVSPMRAMTLDAINLGRAFDIATLGLSNLLRMQQRQVAASLVKGDIGGTALGPGGAGGEVTIPTPLFSGGGGGGGGRARGGGGGGAAPKDDAEKKRRDAIDAAQDLVRAELEIYLAGSKESIAIYENELANKRIAQRDFLLGVAAEREKDIAKEIQGNQQLLDNQKLNFTESERAEILQKIKVLEIEIRVEKLKTAAALTNLTEKEAEEAQRRLENEQKLLEAEQKRLQLAKQRRQLDILQRSIDRRDALIREKYQNTIGSGSEISSIGQLYTKAVEKLSGDQSTAAIAGIEALSTAFQGLGQAVGEVVNAWVLYGSAGASVQQVTAQILAGVAQQAAVKAIFELAEGFAALALAFFGIPNAGPSAQAHFTAAAIYGTIAGVAAVAGRAVAGDSFKKDSGKATGQSSGTGSDREPQEFSRASDTAYQSGNTGTQGRPSWTNVWTEAAHVMKEAASDLHGTAKHLQAAKPGEVFMRGMAQNPGAVGKQVATDIGRNSSIGRDIRAKSGGR